MGLIEVRDYHYDRARIDEYRKWAAQAGPWLRDRFDMSGFWIDSGQEGQLFGADPQPSPLGPANVTWILRWADRADRDAAWEELWENPEWNELWSLHPGFEGYQQLSVRFLDEV